MPLVIRSSWTAHVYCHPSYQSSLLCMTCFSFPSSSAPSGVSILGCCGCSATALPCLCAPRSPKRLPDKCTLIHNTRDGGLYIDSLIPPRPRCNMNFILHQFKCVMSPTRTGSSTYHIYDMLQHIARPGKISEAEKKKVRLWVDQCGFFIINEETSSLSCFPIENYQSIPDVVKLNSTSIFTGDMSHPQRKKTCTVLHVLTITMLVMHIWHRVLTILD